MRWILLPFVFSLVAISVSQGGEVSFSRDVKPILSDRCFHCHGPDAKNQKSDFRLDTAEKAFADLGDYFGIKPGNLEESELHWRIHSEDEDEVMPPAKSKRKLSAEEKKILDDWIKQGAPYESHWSFRPLPEKVEVPLADNEWANNEIDHFIYKKFQ